MQKLNIELKKAEFQEKHPTLGPFLFKKTGETYNGQFYHGKKHGNGLDVKQNGGVFLGAYVDGVK